MRIWFVGGGAFAASCLSHMSRNLTFEKILTGMPTKAGRGLKDQLSCVEKTALGLGLPCERVDRLSRDEGILEILAANPPDLVFVVDFAQLIREPLLNAPRWGCLNIHPSLLPRWRGAAPVQRALMNGDKTSGVTVFRLVEEMDAGPILVQREVPLSVATTAEELFETLALAGSQIAFYGVESLISGSYQFLDQNSEFATYAVKISKAETQTSWSQDNLRVHNTVRALNFSTGAFVLVGNKRLKLWKTLPVEGEGTPGEILRFSEGNPVVACRRGALLLLEVQSEGKRKVGGAEWACGNRLQTGEVLT